MMNKIGAGSFGEIYAGTLYANQVAVKKLKDEQRSPKTIETFREEMVMMTSIHHQNIVQLLGIVSMKDLMIFEMMTSSLRDFLERKDHKYKTIFV